MEPLADLEHPAFGLHQGSWQPSECQPRWNTAVIIPYRNRPSHLAVFLRNIIPFLQMQQLQFSIILVEQRGRTIHWRCQYLRCNFQLLCGPQIPSLSTELLLWILGSLWGKLWAISAALSSMMSTWFQRICPTYLHAPLVSAHSSLVVTIGSISESSCLCMVPSNHLISLQIMSDLGNMVATWVVQLRSDLTISFTLMDFQINSMDGEEKMTIFVRGKFVCSLTPHSFSERCEDLLSTCLHRVSAAHMNVVKVPWEIGRYTMLPHDQDSGNPHQWR